MSKLSIFTNMPEVKSVVVGDTDGALVEEKNEPDGESIAAIFGYLCNEINQCGEMMGFGSAKRITVSGGQGESSVLILRDNRIWTISLHAGKPIAPFEKKLDAILNSGVAK